MKKQKTGALVESVGLERARERWAKEVFCGETDLGFAAWLIRENNLRWKKAAEEGIG